MWAVPDGGFSDSLIGANLPGVILVATSGVGAMLFIIRLVVKFQREFADVYSAENQKLRLRVDELEAEITELKRTATQAERDLLRYEGESERRIRDLEHMVKAREGAANKKISNQLSSVEDLGKVTHALVNSDKTMELHERLVTLNAQLVLSAEVMELNRAAGHKPSPEALAAIKAIESQISALKRSIADRVQQQKAAGTTGADDKMDRKLTELLDHDEERDVPGARYDDDS